MVFQTQSCSSHAFLTEIGTSLKQIVSSPQIYHPYTKGTRRRVLARFRYTVIFLEKDDVILMVAIAHAKRRPGYWSKRL